MREIKRRQNLSDLEPVAALRKLVAFTYDHRFSNENHIRPVNSENIMHEAHLAHSKTIQSLNVPAIANIRDLCDWGV